MNDRIYLDCNTMVGKRGPKDVETPYTTEDLLDEMEWCGIHGALVAHWVAREYDPMYGNRMLMRELKKSPRLFGAWAVMPSHTREIPAPRELVQEMFDNGIHAAKMYPRSHRYPFNLDYCGELLEELQERGVFLIVEGGHLYNPEIFEPGNQVLLTELDRILSACPELNILLQTSRWEATRYLHWLMSKHPNLHLELSNHQGNRAMEQFVHWFGGERILFGSGALDKSPGAAKAFVDYAVLDDETKRKIAGGNLARLLRLEELPRLYRAKKAADPILGLAKEGKPLRNIQVVDAHAHVAHDNAEGIGFMHLSSSDAAGIVERAKVIGIDAVCASSFLAVWADYEEGNDMVWHAMRRYSQFFHGYVSLQPQYVKDWKKELRKWYGRYRMEGMKPYFPRTGIPYNHPVWTPWYEFGNRMRLYALIHPSPNLVAEVNDLARKYPDISFILAHSGGSFHEARLAMEVALKHPNVFLEITLTSVTYRVIEFMVRYIGADRVLFGTDQPMRDPIPQFGWIAYSRCSFEEKKHMLGLNMRKIIRRVRHG